MKSPNTAKKNRFRVAQKAIPYEKVAGYVAASNIARIGFQSGLMAVAIDLIYGGVSEQGRHEFRLRIVCRNYAYLSVRRSEQHDDSECASVILDASLSDASPLIDDFRAGRLQGGLWLSGREGSSVKHLKIAGEIDVDVICEEVLAYAPCKDALGLLEIVEGASG